METFKKVILVFMFILVGTGFVAVAECVIPMAIGDDKHEVVNVVGIDEVILNDNYIINQPLSLSGAKMRLDLGANDFQYVSLKPENIQNFSTSAVGSFEMRIVYGGCSFSFPYKVSYKKIDVGQQIFDFQVDQVVNYEDLYFYCYDYFDQQVKTLSFDEAKVSNLEVEQISKDKQAKIEYNNLSCEFEYNVSYFSSTSNYVGSCKDNDVLYQILQFSPNVDGKIIIMKKILSSNLVEQIYEFDLKRIDSEMSSKFLSSISVATLNYEDLCLTIYKDVVGNAQELNIFIEQGEQLSLNEPYIKNIVSVKNLKKYYIINEEINLNDVLLVVQMSDNSLREVKIDSLNIKGLTAVEVGSFTAVINYFDFSYEFVYSVSYKAIDFYFDKITLTEPFIFNVDSGEIWNFSIICYDANDNAVGYRTLSDANVILSGFDVSTSTEGEVKIATINCFGASINFEYTVI